MTKIAERTDTNPKEGEARYGDVHFADLTNRKYPIDTAEHVRAAWSYINQQGDADKYSPAEVAAIKERIQSAAKKFGVAIAKAFVITKTASGGYRWFSSSSNNALDRDGEIVTAKALEDNVARNLDGRDTSELWLAHIPYRLGGAPDWQKVVDGVLVETGEFDDAPIAKAVARFIEEHPDGIDGSGWGVSISWPGTRKRVYPEVRVKERSVLPLSQAANPYTAFNIEEVQKMALNTQQRALLDTMAADPEAREAAKAILAAVETSKALDDAGVQRKSADVAETPAPVVPPVVDPVSKTASVLTDDDMAGIVMYVEEQVEKRVKAASASLAGEVNEALAALVKQNNDLTAEIEKMRDQEQVLHDDYVEPRGVSLYNRLKSFSASASDATKIDEKDPLAVAKPSDDQDVFARFGLG